MTYVYLLAAANVALVLYALRVWQLEMRDIANEADAEPDVTTSVNVITDPAAVRRLRWDHWCRFQEAVTRWETAQHRRVSCAELEAQLASSIADEARTRARKQYRQDDR